MVWTPEQTGEFLDFLANDRVAAMWHGFIFRGPRRGKMCALPWSEVSLSGSWFRISAQTVEVAYRTYDEAPKQDSVRTITLDAQTKALWIAWRETQQQEREQWSGEKAWVDSGRVWTHENGEALHPDWISRRFNRPRRAVRPASHTSARHPTSVRDAGAPREGGHQGRSGAAGTQLPPDHLGHLHQRPAAASDGRGGVHERGRPQVEAAQPESGGGEGERQPQQGQEA